MEEVSGPVVAIALILAAVFVPTAFIPGITGRMYQQFAVTIAVSVLISAFNALTLSPAPGGAAAAAAAGDARAARGVLPRVQPRGLARATDGYVGACGASHPQVRLLDAAPRWSSPCCAGLVGSRLPGGLRPRRGPGLLLRQRPASRWPRRSQRTAAVSDKIDAHPQDDAGRQVLHGRRRLQPAEPRDHHLQRASTSSRSTPGTSGTRRGSPPT